MSPGSNVGSAMTRDELRRKGIRVAKFSRYRTHREQGGRVKLTARATYVLVISRYFADEKIEFKLRTYADGDYNIE